MPSRISRIGVRFASTEGGYRPRRCAALRVRRPPGQATAVGYRRSRAGLDGSRATSDRNRRPPLLRRLGQRSVLLRRHGALNNLQFTGDDFFADKNVCSIVLEVPTLPWGPKRLACGTARWLRQREGAGPGPGRAWSAPLQLFLVLGLSAAERDAYLAGDPADDTRFIAAFAHALEHTGGYTSEEQSGWPGQCSGGTVL